MTPARELTSAGRLGTLARSSLAPLAVGALLLVVLGWYCRLHDLGFPTTFLFDEHHFVENARRYLAGQADDNDHPPLGKLVIAFSIRQLGDTPLGWRAPSLVYGAALVALGALTARRLFDSTAATVLAAAFLSGDGFFIAYSRAALLDGALALAAIAALYWSTRECDWEAALVGGFIAGTAMSFKFSGVAALIPLWVSVWLSWGSPRRRLGLASIIGLTAGGVYVAWFVLGLAVSGRPATVAVALAETQRLFTHHAVLTDMKNAWTSSWVTWVVPTRPLLLGLVGKSGTLRALSTLGNLVLWWAASSLSVVVAGLVVHRGLRSLVVENEKQIETSLPPAHPIADNLWRFCLAHGRAVVSTLATAGAFLAPWVLTHRDSYIYHFLPVYACLVVLLAGYLGWLFERRPGWVLGYVAAVIVVSFAYAPVWSFTPVTDGAFRHRLFLSSWR